MHNREEILALFSQVLDVMDFLRERCAWNGSQTFESLRTQSLEEMYELSDAVLKGSTDDIRKELGDLLLHIVFYSRIAREKGLWDVGDVMQGLCEKMIYRHPHVFPGGVYPPDENARPMTPEEVATAWEMLKTKEKGGNKTVLAGVPTALPALIKANRIQEKAANVGFDWEERLQVWDKVKEEISEVEQEMEAGEGNDLEGEFGDLLFAVVNAARLYGVNPENALERTNRKFISRFNHLEKRAKEMNVALKEMSLSEMDKIWDEAKAIEQNNTKTVE